MKKPNSLVVVLLLVSLSTSGCSVIMAASRSSYRGDVSVMKEGANRSTVIAELGEPDSFNKTENSEYEDRYILDPDAHKTWVKVLTAIFHLGADLVTAFLWELVGTPYEIAVKDRIVTYQLLYSQEGVLQSITKNK